MPTLSSHGALPDRHLLIDLYDRLDQLRRSVLTDAARLQRACRGDDDSPSLRNCAHYLALRTHDLRPLQELLGQCALSSLGRSEAHVMATLECLLALLAAVLGRPEPLDGAAPVSYTTGRRFLLANRVRLFGPLPATRPSHFLVTMPRTAAGTPASPRV